MKSCLRRLGRLGQVARWPAALAVVVFFLFHLSSFLKEPSTQPSRYQYRQDVKERAPELPPKAMPQAEAVLEGGTLDPRHPAGDSVRTEPTKAPPEQRRHAPSPAATASAKSQAGDRNEADTVSPPGQAAARVSNQTKAPTTKTAPGTKTTKGSRDPTRRPTASKSAVVKPQGRAGTTAKRLVPPSQGKPKTTATTTPAAATAKTRKSGATTVAVAPAKKVPVTPAPAQPPSTRGTPRLKAANFKSEPRWDFEEQYSMDAAGLKTSCPDSIKVRAARSPWLRSLFLPNLTLFLDSGHFNQSEWDRLEHFGPPFGFMELNHSLVQKVVAHFPPVPQQQLLLASNPPGGSQCITCAVVGNGGILNNSKVGQEIDSHDYVFRLSGAVIKGYEQDVGTRTSFYGFTAFSVTQSLLILGSRGFQSVPVGKDIRYLHFLEGTRDFEWLEALLQNQTLAKKNLFWFRRRPQEAFKEALTLDKYLLLHPDFLRYMKNRFLRSKTLDTAHWRIYRPTTGALLLLTALHLCDKVSAYGFITEGHERFSDHYYDKTWKKLIFYINHDFKLERDVWKRLHDEGLIRLFQRPDTARAKS
ncbi:alpha-N-acetylgalactosaminide alpha-2,6-sialyltransferase 1 isoform X1 [Oryctolagus cuniculus]|uniref:alpha-N-acetylgalactosaminide alpha-2,6-sialyltransferase n=1 Tax=Oryctolagus cuniculus TaxID=9986 RepID=G1U2C0_RABIT|nr:alpha-N-acetylgalactosaminide alpha-2,6-sialyltransferase 1 isoform X1 [Oryctolagus cuniculus]